MTGTPDDRPGRSAATAVVLSFIWPGLGQAYQRRPRPAAVFAIPMLVLAGIVGLLLLARGPQGVAISLLESGYALALIAGAVISGAWRLVAMAEAWRHARGAGSPGRLAAGLLISLGVLVGAMHGYVGYLGYAVYDAASQIFVNGDDGFPNESLAPGESDDPGEGVIPGGSPSAMPDPSAEAPGELPAPGERISILLTGIDSTPTRTHALTDTLLLVSVDPATGAGAMVSLPRDLARLPLYFGGTYSGKINSLLSYARRHPEQFPDKPATTLTREVGYLVGIPVQYYAAVDLAGFVRIIDLVGGVTVDNPRAIDDFHYGGWTNGHPIGFHLTEGKHSLDGQTALAFVRSRMGAGDNDFTRARRQQLLLLALRAKLTNPDMLPKLPDLLKAAASSIKTNFPADGLDEMLTLAGEVKGSDVDRVVFGGDYADRATDTSTYELILDMKKVAKVSVRLFGEDSRYYKPPASPSPSVAP